MITYSLIKEVLWSELSVCRSSYSIMVRPHFIVFSNDYRISARLGYVDARRSRSLRELSVVCVEVKSLFVGIVGSCRLVILLCIGINRNLLVVGGSRYVISLLLTLAVIGHVVAVPFLFKAFGFFTFPFSLFTYSIEDLKRIGFRFGCKITTNKRKTASQIGQKAKQNRQKRLQTPINKGFGRNVKSKREKCREV